MLLQHEEEEISSRSSGITALPRWDSARYADRPRLPISFPIRVYSSHGRKSSKHSQAPILEDESNKKKTGLRGGLASLGADRPGSNGSEWKSSQLPARNGSETRRQRRSRKLIWLVAALIVLLALAIILGAVLGTSIKSGRSSPVTLPQVTEIPAGTLPTPTTTQPTASPTETKTPRSENQLASIAVTGWRVPGSQGYNSIWLFWQNREGYLSRAAYNSSTGNWTRVTNFVKAKAGTPIAAATANFEYYAGQEVRVS